LAANLRIESIDVAGSLLMKLRQPVAQKLGAGLGMSDEVVVIGENRPGFELPAGLLRPAEQSLSN
jgi:hypothetical protein